MSSKLPDAAPIPDRPPLHLRGGFLCIAAPISMAEACVAVPAIRALRHFRPASTMAVICSESQVPLWETMPELNHVISYPEKASARQIAKIIEAHEVKFESSICWEGGEVAKAFQRADILQRLGYPAKDVEKYLTDPVKVIVEPAPIEHRVRYYLKLVHELGGDPFVRQNFATPALAVPAQKPLIALAPDSEYGATHQWPIEKFKELIDTYEATFGEADWVILSSGANNAPNKIKTDFRSALGEKVKDYTEEWGLEKTLSGLPYCSALVSSDNELAHLAAHVGLPAVVVFGPNEPEWKRPLGKQSRVVREHVACSPCFLTKCPLDMRCQDEVSVQMVMEQLQAALAERYAQ